MVRRIGELPTTPGELKRNAAALGPPGPPNLCLWFVPRKAGMGPRRTGHHAVSTLAGRCVFSLAHETILIMILSGCRWSTLRYRVFRVQKPIPEKRA